MAIVAEILVSVGSQDQFHHLDASIGQTMAEMGGPPAGLMAHHVRPAGDGFLISEVWRTETDMRSFYEKVMLAKFAEVGLDAQAPTIHPVWSFARP